MRAIMNISVPQKVKEEIEIAVKKGGFVTKSEFIRDLIRLWKEERLFQELKQSQRDVAKGKGKILRTLKDLR